MADTLNLPHPDAAFDFAICVAVIHHLATRRRRVQAIRHVVAKLNLRREGSASTGQRQQWGGGGGGTWEGESKNENENEERSAGGVPTTGKRMSMEPGQALIFVWALEQKDSRRGWDRGMEKDRLVPWVLKQDSRKRERSAQAASAVGNEIEGQDGEQERGNNGGRDEAEVRGHNEGKGTGGDVGNEGQKIFERYYHLYEEGELESEVAEAGGVVVESGYDRDNWWVVVESADSASDEGG